MTATTSAPHRATLIVMAVLAAALVVSSAFEAMARPIQVDHRHAGLAIDDQFDLPPHLVDINQADAATLQLLPGIGPALADRIVRSREADGRFDSIDDLDRVHGIGMRTIERFRAFADAR